LLLLFLVYNRVGIIEKIKNGKDLSKNAPKLLIQYNSCDNRRSHSQGWQEWQLMQK